MSPLLSNVVLNELDWWISNQWENFPTRHRYKCYVNKRGAKDKATIYKALRKNSNLKEMYMVRYADDFKIFTNDHKKAWKIFHAVKGYLKSHLCLDISPEKSKVINLRRCKSEFLGFTIKATKKRKKYVTHTHISPKKRDKITNELVTKIKAIQKHPSFKNINDYNTYVIGIKNYFSVATHVSIDLAEIQYRLSRTLYNRLKSIGKYGIPEKASKTYKKFNSLKCKTYNINGIPLFPIAGQKTVNNRNFCQTICNYTEMGRAKKHHQLDEYIQMELHKMMANPIASQTMEYNDNRLSIYSCQQGRCSVTGIPLWAKDVHCHHKIPKHLGGTDKFDNLVIIHQDVHRLIHATKDKTIKRYQSLLQLNLEQLNKVNEYRKTCNLIELVNS